MIIKINTKNCSREEVKELLDYLEENSWNFVKEETFKKEFKYTLFENGIQINDDNIIGPAFVTLNERIRDEELHEYYIVERESLISDLIRWINENNKDSSLMKTDLKMLMLWEDDYILTSNSTNSYIRQKSSNFNDTCEELIKLNIELNSKLNIK